MAKKKITLSEDAKKRFQQLGNVKVLNEGDLLKQGGNKQDALSGVADHKSSPMKGEGLVKEGEMPDMEDKTPMNEGDGGVVRSRKQDQVDLQALEQEADAEGLIFAVRKDPQGGYVVDFMESDPAPLGDVREEEELDDVDAMDPVAQDVAADMGDDMPVPMDDAPMDDMGGEDEEVDDMAVNSALQDLFAALGIDAEIEVSDGDMPASDMGGDMDDMGDDMPAPDMPDVEDEPAEDEEDLEEESIQMMEKYLRSQKKKLAERKKAARVSKRREKKK